MSLSPSTMSLPASDSPSLSALSNSGLARSPSRNDCVNGPVMPGNVTAAASRTASRTGLDSSVAGGAAIPEAHVSPCVSLLSNVGIVISSRLVDVEAPTQADEQPLVEGLGEVARAHARRPGIEAHVG